MKINLENSICVKPNLYKLIMNNYKKIKETKYWEVYQNCRSKVYYNKEDDSIGAEIIFGDNPQEVGFEFLKDKKYRMKGG